MRLYGDTETGKKVINGIGRLFQGMIYIKGSGMCLFIHRHMVIQYRKVAYIWIVCNIRLKKKETHIIRITVSGNKLIYDCPIPTPTAYLKTSKLQWNSFLSNPNGKYLIVDVNNFYLNNLLKKKKYYQILIKLIPQYIIDKYELDNKKIYGYIYLRV